VDGRRMAYHQGPRVDPADELNGQKFQNVDEFKQILLKDKDQIARALTTKLLTYATGAAPQASDEPEIETMVAGLRDHDYGLRSLVHAIVQSKLFQSK